MSHPFDESVLDLIRATDPTAAEILEHETERQESTLELIASENHVSPAVMHAMGSLPDEQVRRGVSRGTVLRRVPVP
jgi:glycine hydroxymethyltransferase